MMLVDIILTQILQGIKDDNKYIVVKNSFMQVISIEYVEKTVLHCIGENLQQITQIKSTLVNVQRLKSYWTFIIKN